MEWQHELIEDRHFESDVVDARGEPVRDAAISLQARARLLRGVVDAEAVAERPDRYRADGLPAGRYQAVVQGSHEGAIWTEGVDCDVPGEPLRVVLGGKARLSLNLRLDPALGCRQLDETRVHGRSDAATSEWMAVSDALGHTPDLGLRAIRIGPGTHELAARGASMGLPLCGSTLIVVGPDASHVSADLMLRLAREISGRVVDEQGLGVAGVRISASIAPARSPRAEFPWETTRSAIEGSFRLLAREECLWLSADAGPKGRDVVQAIETAIQPLVIVLR